MINDDENVEKACRKRKADADAKAQNLKKRLKIADREARKIHAKLAAIKHRTVAHERLKSYHTTTEH